MKNSFLNPSVGSASAQRLVKLTFRNRCCCWGVKHSDATTTDMFRFLLQEWDETVNPILEHFSGEDRSLQDSFRPLIGQLTDQSSCLAADHRDSALERLVGQPSAHSSVIGQLPGVPVPPVSLDQGGWDSTLSRMIGRLSHQSSSHWLSGGQDFYAGQLIGQMVSERSTSWFDGEPEESRMRPLVGELDESAGQHSGSSGKRIEISEMCG